MSLIFYSTSTILEKFPSILLSQHHFIVHNFQAIAVITVICEYFVGSGPNAIEYQKKSSMVKSLFHPKLNPHKMFKSALGLLDHIDIRHCTSETIRRLFDCDKCGRVFNHQSNLNSHISSIHSSNLNKCRCIDCGKYYKSIDCLQQHRRQVHTTIRYKCDRCDKEVKDYGYFIRHIRSAHK